MFVFYLLSQNAWWPSEGRFFSFWRLFNAPWFGRKIDFGLEENDLSCTKYSPVKWTTQQQEWLLLDKDALHLILSDLLVLFYLNSRYHWVWLNFLFFEELVFLWAFIRYQMPSGHFAFTSPLILWASLWGGHHCHPNVPFPDPKAGGGRKGSRPDKHMPESVPLLLPWTPGCLT